MFTPQEPPPHHRSTKSLPGDNWISSVTSWQSYSFLNIGTLLLIDYRNQSMDKHRG
jgi:hypothetical protein